MKLEVLMLAIALAIPGGVEQVLAARKPIKCGIVLAKRAERRHMLGYRVVRMPKGCEAGVTMPLPYATTDGEFGPEIWRWSERLVWAVDTAERPIADPPLSTKLAKPKVKRTLTRDWWKGDQHYVVTEVYP